MTEAITIALISGLGTLLTVVLGFFFALKKIDRNIEINARQDQRRRQADALEHTWTLLQYLTLTENNDNILTWEEEKTKPPQKSYYLNVSNAEKFIFEILPDVFYQKNAGLYLTREHKELLFQYRNLIYGILLKEKNRGGMPEKIQIEQERTWKTMQDCYHKLNNILREDIKQIYEKMQKTEPK